MSSAATCSIPTPASWRQVIGTSTVHLPASARVIPFAPGTGPDRFFAEVYSPAFSGVAEITAPTGGITQIHAFANPSTDQAYAGQFDGRWLVWIVQKSLGDWNDWEIWAWDSSTNVSFRVAASPVADGHPISGPVVEPVVAAGVAAWVQANKDGFGDVHMFTLERRHDAVVDSHATTPITFWGSRLLWMHLDVAGQSGHFQMVDSLGRPLTVPEPLASVRSAAYVATSPKLLAWTDGHSLWIYRSGEAGPRLARQADGDTLQFIAIAGDLVTWDGEGSPGAFDVRASTVTTLTAASGGRFASGNSLLVYWPVGNAGSKDGGIAIADVDTSRLPPLPRC